MSRLAIHACHHHHAQCWVSRPLALALRCDALRECPRSCPEQDPLPLPPPPPPDPSTQLRRTYAVAPVGDISVIDRDPTPETTEIVRTINFAYVTNLGTLLDVMA